MAPEQDSARPSRLARSPSGPAGAGVLVTGAGRGIGRAVAERLAADGYRVAVNDIDAGSATAVANGIGGVAVPGDVSVEESARRVVTNSIDELGVLCGVVNNAGIEARRPFRDHDTDLWWRVLDVNLTSAFLVCRAAADHLARSGRGAVVNIASIAVIGSSGQVAYDVSKGGLQTLSRSLAMELGPEGIRVNAVCPGLIDTEMLRMNDLVVLGEKVASKQPIARLGSPDEVAAAVSFLLSDDASYITGHSLFVDGGHVRS